MEHVKNSDLLRSRVTDLWMKHGRAILTPVKIVASFLPGGKDRVEIIENELLGSDLNISPLTTGDRLRPLAGLSPLTLPSDKTVFPEGFNASFTFSHNEKGEENILLREMSLVVDDFTPGLNTHYSYSREGEKIIGAGIVEPWCFLTTVRSSQVTAAYWTQTQTDKSVRGTSDNFFETDPPRLLSFSKGERFIQEVAGTIRTVEPGLYTLRFRFGYSIAGRKDLTYYSEPVIVYNGESDE